MKKHIDILTLGCSKNLVDSERLMGQLEALGYVCHHDPEQCTSPIAIINTCGFIGDAKEESVNTILQFGERKKSLEDGSGAAYSLEFRGEKLEKLYVMGCLSQRYMQELKEEIPEVDGWFGKFDYDGIVKQLQAASLEDGSKAAYSLEDGSGAAYSLEDGSRAAYSLEVRGEKARRRKLTTPKHYAYEKISEGCNRMCSYCAIPLITGRHTSRKKEEILDEVRWMVSQGVKEVNVIAQDLSSYGLDLYDKHCLPELIDEMAQITGLEWIRLHYAYPTDFPDEILDVMAKHDNVCKYLDIALQHCTNHMLRQMQRHITAEDQDTLISRIRERVPGICIRTTLMVGHPGESEEDFSALCDWVKKMQFERMGAFAYSEEEGTYAAKHYKDDIPDEIKQKRLSKLMDIQQQISYEIQQKKVGKTYRVIIDREEDDYWIGRTEFDSPEVDCEVLVEKVKGERLKVKGIKIGDIINVEITKAEEFDLYGKQTNMGGA